MSTEQQAALLEEIAQVMRERPEGWWREFEILVYPNGYGDHGEWVQCWASYQPTEWFYPEKVRRRPRTITIAGIEVPEPMRNKPPLRTECWRIDLRDEPLAMRMIWDDVGAEKLWLRRGLLHLTEEAAQQHARALILASGGKVE